MRANIPLNLSATSCFGRSAARKLHAQAKSKFRGCELDVKEIRKWQQSAMKLTKQRDLGVTTRLGIAKDVALWEIAAQLAIIARELKGKKL